MAVLTQMPSIDVVKGFQGTLDFYVDKGQAICRKWPRKYTGPPTERSLQSSLDFTAVQWASSCMHPGLCQVARNYASGTPLTWRDVLTKTAINCDRTPRG
jgi:hypothetical protein